MGLTALSADFAFGAILLGIVTIVAGLGWGYLVRVWAKEEAQKAAQEWLNKEGPRILREGASLLNPDGDELNPTAAEQEADEIGQNAG